MLTEIDAWHAADTATPRHALAGRHGPLRVLHVMSLSLPHLNGYSIRGNYLVQTQRADGLDPHVVTSPFYPGNPASLHEAVIDGVPHYRVPHPRDADGPLCWEARLVRALGGKRRARQDQPAARRPAPWKRRRRGLRWALGKMSPRLWTQRLWGHARKLLAGADTPLRFRYGNAIERLLLAYFTRELTSLARGLQPDLIHAHTPYYCGLAALRASRRLGVPLVYEVRGVWEETAVGSGRFQRDGRAYQRWRKLEDAVMRQADAVVCICEQLRHEVVSRGVDPRRVFVVPNAVDPVKFQPPSAPTAAALPESVRRVADRLPGQTLGYIGSLRALEGVEYLVRAAALLAQQGRDVSLLVVGGANNLDQLQTLAAELGLADRAVFTGPVPHDEVGFYYQLIDVFVVSRPPLRVTELVTPLKPLEAMAMGKALVASDLPALRELAGSEETARFFKAGDAADLAQQCRLLLEDRTLRQRMAHAARQWVQQHRNWTVVLQRLYPAYESVLAARRAAA